jgi:capsular exopolysaccharide synthesis family protein
MSGILDPHLVSLVSPGSFEAEQYRALRHRLERRRETVPLQALAITSASVGDGKTTTAINLAGALAQARDGRVLLVDADVRRPAIAAQVGLGEVRPPGLVDAVLDPGRGIEDLVHPLPGLNLTVLAAGRLPDAPYEVLKSRRLGELLEQARRLYEFVIVDTPPVVPVPDSRLIARWVDGLLLVVSAHRTPRKLLEEALNQIDPARLVGLVFNGDDRPFSGYSGYYGAYGRPQKGEADVGASRLLAGS